MNWQSRAQIICSFHSIVPFIFSSQHNTTEKVWKSNVSNKETSEWLTFKMFSSHSYPEWQNYSTYVKCFWEKSKARASAQPRWRCYNKVLWARADFEWHFNLNPLAHTWALTKLVWQQSTPGPDIWSRLLIFTDQSVWGQRMSDTSTR